MYRNQKTAGIRTVWWLRRVDWDSLNTWTQKTLLNSLVLYN